MAYGTGKGKRKPKQKKMMKRYYRKNRTKLKKEQRKRDDRYGPERLERPGGVSKTKRKQYRERDYPESINQPRTANECASELLYVASLLFDAPSPVDHPLSIP